MAAEVYRPSSNSASLVAPLTGEEVRAYRTHRKRLARIVADQWLYAARFRLLALRFHKQHAEKLKRYCLSEWKVLVEERRRMWEILERATVLRQFLLERRSFHSWLLAVQIQQRIRKAFNRTTETINSNTRRKVLVALQAYSRRTIYKRGQRIEIETIWTRRLQRKCLIEWNYLMYEHRLWKKKKERANKKLAERLLKLALRGWNGILPLKQELATNTEPYNLLLHVRLLTKWFWRWNLYVSQKKAVINPARDKQLILAQRHHERKLLRSAFDGWDRVRFSTCLAREVDQHSLEASATEVAVSWFMKSLVKRFLVYWKKQASILKNHRRNHWHAVVHFKMQSAAKGLRGFQKNVQLEHVKRSLEELSLESYQQRLKRKAVTGCKLLHQSKRLKSAKLEHATAQWRTAKLQEHFEKWYLTMAVRSMKKKQLLKSIKFWCRQLCLRGFQAWRAFRDLSKQKKLSEKIWLKRMRETLSRLRQMQVLRAWRALQKKIIVKRFNEARALQFYIGFTAAAVVKALQVNMQKQQRKRSLLTKSREFWKTKYLQRALLTWKKFLLFRQLGRISDDQRRRRLLKLALFGLSLCKEQQNQVKFEETSVEDSRENLRKFTETETAQMSTEREVVQITPISAPRLQPRRPAFLYENDNQTKETKLGLKVADHNVNFISPAKNPHFVAKEIEWMEQILLEYEDLKVHLLKLRAELALLLETRSPEKRESSHPRDQKQPSQEQKTLLLQQEIHSLEAKKMVQMPLIQAVLSRVQDLRFNKVPTL